MFRQLPNLITLTRIVVLALLVWLVFAEWTGAATLAFFCILYGSISDFVDGYIARKYNLISNFGKIMDALVDKVMTLGSFILLLVIGLLEPMPMMALIVALMALREGGITLLRLVAARKSIVLAADTSGKRKTIWQVTAICVLFAVPMFEVDLARIWGVDLGGYAHYVWLNGMLYFFLSAWLTIASGIGYARRYLPLVLASGQTRAPS